MRYFSTITWTIMMFWSSTHANQSETIPETYFNHTFSSIQSNSHALDQQHQKQLQQKLRRRTQSKRPLNILALGGSITWGSKLADRSQAYPNLLSKLGHHNVRNRALRATGSFYPAVCLESMMKGDDTPYDVVVLEFTINGVRAFDWLVKRLRARYPNVTIIYVHLYSLKYNIMDDLGRTPFERGIYSNFREHDDITWYYKNFDQLQKVPPQVRDIPSEWDMHSYHLPFPRFPSYAADWFASDWHHLSPIGHKKVAESLLEMLSNFAEQNELAPYVEGTYGLGDTCENWFGSGETDLSYLKGEMKPIVKDGIFQGKYSIEYESGVEGAIVLPNTQRRAPVWMHYLSSGLKNPDATVVLGDEETVVDHETFKIAMGDYVDTKQIGWAETADNYITIKPEDGFEEPFRLVAIGFCGACFEKIIGEYPGQPSIQGNS